MSSRSITEINRNQSPKLEDSRRKIQFLPRYGPNYTSIIYRLIMFSLCLSVPIFKWHHGYSYGYINMSNWAVYETMITSFLGIILYCFKTPKNHILTEIYSHFFAASYPSLFVITLVVFFNNFVHHWGSNQYDTTYDIIIEHAAIPL